MKVNLINSVRNRYRLVEILESNTIKRAILARNGIASKGEPSTVRVTIPLHIATEIFL